VTTDVGGNNEICTAEGNHIPVVDHWYCATQEQIRAELESEEGRALIKAAVQEEMKSMMKSEEHKAKMKEQMKKMMKGMKE